MSPKSAPPVAERPLRLVFLYMKGRAARLAEVERGAAPTEFFYGAIELARQGHQIAQFEIDSDAPAGIAERVVGRLWPGFARPVKMDASILIGVFRFATELNRADCIVATGGNIAFAAAALAAVGVIRRPILGIQCGVLHFKHGFWRRRLSSALLRRMHTLLFGEAELEPMRRFFDLPAEVISVNLFGVDPQFWQPDASVSRDLVLAVGNDTRRDFSTLVEAAKRIAAPVHIVTKLTLPSPLPENVTQHRGSWHGSELSDEKIRELYRRARVVVVPLHPSNQPSGQSVTLQAMACGCPVVLTETEGLWSRQQLQDGLNVRLIPPHDPGSLANCVNGLLADANECVRLGSAARTTAEGTGNVEHFASRVVKAASAMVQQAGSL